MTLIQKKVLIFTFLFDIVIMQKIGGSIMRREYSDPIVEIRKYVLSEDVCTNPSNPDTGGDLHDEDEYDYFG